MNYTSAALGVIGVISLLTWITTGRKNFTGPAIVNQDSDESKKDGAEQSVDVNEVVEGKT